MDNEMIGSLEGFGITPDGLEDAVIDHMYLYDDGPLLFSVQKGSKWYLASIANDTDEIMTWIFAPLNDHKKLFIQNGNMDIRSAFTDPDGKVIQFDQIRSVELQNDGQYKWTRWTSKTSILDQVPESLLPEAGGFLNPDGSLRL